MGGHLKAYTKSRKRQAILLMVNQNNLDKQNYSLLPSDYIVRDTENKFATISMAAYHWAFIMNILISIPQAIIVTH